MNTLTKKDPSVTANCVIFVLSLIGLVIALYVTQSFLRKTGIICVNTGCELVRKSPSSYLFGVIPVPSVGLIGYALLATFAFLRTGGKNAWTKMAMLCVSLFGVCFVSWFTYTEIFIIKGMCTWCAISAINMYAILFLVLRLPNTIEVHS